MGALLDDYLSGDPGLLDAYAGDPRTIATTGVTPRAWDASLIEGIRACQSHLGGQATFTGTEGVIITGQQPGIFGGPLYTIYKAITAIRLARALQEETGVPFVPIYWVGGDDHDFDEIRQVQLLSKNHTSVPLALAGESLSRSVFQYPISPELHDLVDSAAIQAPGSEFAADVQAFLHESLEASSNLSEWHARLMARLFRGTPLLLFSPDLPEARRAAVPIFEREIRQPLASTRALNEGGARLEAAGYGAQVVKGDDACNFFLERHGIRCRVRHVEGSFLLPDTGEKFSESELLQLLHAEPERFTANVALRCVVQQHLFPVRAYVAGPGELAYWGQLKGVFALFDTPMPLVYPRIRGVLTTLKTNKLLGKYGLRPADLYAPAAELEDRALRAGEPSPGLAVFARHRDALHAQLASMHQDFAVLGKTGKVASTLAGPFESQVQQGLEYLERALLHADESRTSTVKQQIARLSTELAPDRKPQERCYTIFSWLFQHGWELIPKLEKALDHRDFGLQEVEL